MERNLLPSVAVAVLALGLLTSLAASSKSTSSQDKSSRASANGTYVGEEAFWVSMRRRKAILACLFVALLATRLFGLGFAASTDDGRRALVQVLSDIGWSIAHVSIFVTMISA